MYLCSSYCILYMFSVSDSSIYMIYCYSFNFPYVTCTCMPGPHHLIMYTCVSYARHLALLYVLAGLRLITLDSHVQILETGPWWPYYTRSECAAGPPVVVRALPKLGRHRSSSFSSSTVWLTRSLLLYCEHLSASIYLFMYCTFVSSSDVIFQ